MISVSKCRVRDTLKWRVRWHEGGRVRRKFFGGRDGADAHAAQLRGEEVAARRRLAALAQQDQEQLMMLFDEAGRQNVPLPRLLAMLAEAKARGAGGPAADAVLSEMKEAKRKAGRAREYLANLGQIIGSFIKGREKLAVDLFGFADVEKFIDRFNLQTRPTVRSRLATWFKFAVRRGYRNDNPCDRLEPVTVPRRIPKTLTLKQTEAALEWFAGRPRAWAWFLLSTFAGLRPDEARKTRRAMLNFKENWIRVESQTTKVRERRIVYPLPGVMPSIQRALRRGAKLPLTKKQLQVERRSLRVALGFKKWPQDVTRHTAASMWLAMAKDGEKVAENLGHSEKVLHRNYKALKTRAEAEKFWSILNQR